MPAPVSPLPASARDPEENLTKLLTVEVRPDGSLATLPEGGNMNGRVFGGQLLGLMLTAAGHGIGDRAATSLQLQFMQGALIGQPMAFAVETLQEGRRFATRHVRATQADRMIALATVGFQAPGTGLEHDPAMPTGLPGPDDVPTLDELDAHIGRTNPGGPYTLQQKRCLDLRLIDAIPMLYQPNPAGRVRWWVKARHPLADAPLLHAAALAYMSDTWLAFASISPHAPMVGTREALYVASLNHSMWLTRPCRADDWLLFDVEGTRAGGGRTLSQARVFSRDGRLAACVSQELAVSQRQA